jgi:hypothetical protein
VASEVAGGGKTLRARVAAIFAGVFGGSFASTEGLVKLKRVEKGMRDGPVTLYGHLGYDENW